MELLTKTFYGNTVLQWLTALAIIVGASQSQPPSE